jgi:hypothetical protein
VVGQLIAPQVYETLKVRPLYVEYMNLSDKLGWSLAHHPTTNTLIVNTPESDTGQLLMSYVNRSWTRWESLDIVSMAVWNGQLYFGDRAGRVCISEGFVDNVGLAGDTTNSKTVDCRVLSGFSNLGSNGKKLVTLAAPSFITRGVTPAYEAFIRFDFDIREPTGAVTADPPSTDVLIWDTGSWDVNLWGSGQGVGYRRTFGTRGQGTFIAAGVHFQAQDYCVLTHMDIFYEEGGIL